MENGRRKNTPAGDMFSFPVIIPDSDQFEFRQCVTTRESLKSPADHLFFNGKLLPHAFPIQTRSSFSYSRSTSRTSSKDSLMSSRSNSTNSRSSSARTSISEAASSTPGRTSVGKQRKKPPVVSCQYQYGSSQRWQLFAAAPVPVLKHQGSRSRKGPKKPRGSDEEPAGAGGAKSWVGRKIFKSFISVCQEFHAIKT